VTDNKTLLGRVPLFSGLKPESIGAIAAQMRRRVYLPNTPILYKGDSERTLYIIVSGRVKVHQFTARGDDVFLQVLAPGESFGELSLLDGQPRSASISTLEKTELAFLSGDMLQEILGSQPKVAWAMLEVLSRRIREQNTKLESLMTSDVTGRVAQQMVVLADAHGLPASPDGAQILINVDLTQSDIAALVGATRERVSRTLAQFRAQGSLEWNRERGRWIVIDRTALVKRSAM